MMTGEEDGLCSDQGQGPSRVPQVTICLLHWYLISVDCLPALLCLESLTAMLSPQEFYP